MPATSAEAERSDVDLVILGSANLDLVAQTAHLPAPGETVMGSSYQEYPGGKGLNQAVAAARAGARVQFWGHLGDDSAGELLREVVRSEGIDDQFLLVDPLLPTGRAMIWVDDHAENSILVIPGANHAVHVTGMSDPLPSGSTRDNDDAARDEALVAARVVLTQLEVPLLAVEDFFLRAGKCGCLRIMNPAPAQELSEDLLGNCEILIPNEGELVALGGRQRLHTLGVRAVIETCGARGVRCSMSDASGQIVHEWTQTAFAVSAVDSTGAGDVFSGYLAAALASTVVHESQVSSKDLVSYEQMREAVRSAAAAAAISVTVKGAVPSVPHRSQVDQMLSESASPE